MDLFAFVVLMVVGMAMAARQERKRREYWASIIEGMEEMCEEAYEEGYRDGEDAQHANCTVCAGQDEEDDAV